MSLGTVLAVLALGACGAAAQEPTGLTGTPPTATDDADPAPSVPPDESTEPSTEQQHTEAAQAAYEEYVAAMNTVAQDGFADPAPVVALLWGDDAYRTAVIDDLRDKAARGITQTGEQRLAGLTVTEYVPDPSDAGHESVVLDACVDSSGYDQVDPSGTSILVDDGIDRRPATVTMNHQSEDRWTVSTVEWRQGQTC